MSPDQEQRLLEAAQNWSELIVTFIDAEIDPIEDFISVLNGQAAKIEEKTMPRGRKKQVSVPAEVTAAPQPTPTAVAIPDDLTGLITEWTQADEAARLAKAKEHSLRQAIVARCFDGNKLEGTERKDVGWGMQLKVTKAMNYSATNKEGQTTKLIEALEARGQVAAPLAETLVDWKPDISKPVYREVLRLAQQFNDTVLLELLHAAVTVKPGMPELELVPAIAPAPEAAQPPVYVIEQDFLP